MERLPRLGSAVARIRVHSPGLPDFDIFRLLLEETVGDSLEHAMLKCEIQHFLAGAYSQFQSVVDRIDLTPWRWSQWISAAIGDISCIVSFNYDLILERTLEHAGTTYRRLGVASERTGLCVIKPHGSIDFEIHGIKVPVGYPLKNAVLHNDAPLRALSANELLSPRTEVDIVVPTEYSPFLQFQWVAPAYTWFASRAKELTHCFFVGLSYWECDRPELDFLLDALSPDACVVIANPDPPQAFCDAVARKFARYDVWKHGPDPSMLSGA